MVPLIFGNSHMVLGLEFGVSGRGFLSSEALRVDLRFSRLRLGIWALGLRGLWVCALRLSGLGCWEG